MSPRPRPLALTGLVLVVGLSACAPDEYPVIYSEDFEDELCDGTPCGWQQARGSSGEARWVETIHPGEHALQLRGEVTVLTSLEDVSLASEDLLATLTGRCLGPGDPTLSLVVQDSAGTRTISASPVLSEAWDEAGVELFDSLPLTGARVVALAIGQGESASCDVAAVRLTDPCLALDAPCR